MRTPYVVGNWKMHGTVREARDLAQAVRDGLKRPRGVEVAVCPPFTALPAVSEVLAGSPVALGAQNCHWEDKGAFTGEISPPMLVDLGCRLVLLGHSERRHIFRETDDEINKRVVAALRHGLRPLLCVGETRRGAPAGADLHRGRRAAPRGVGGTERRGDRPVLSRLRARLGDRDWRQCDAEPGRRGPWLPARADLRGWIEGARPVRPHPLRRQCQAGQCRGPSPRSRTSTASSSAAPACRPRASSPSRRSAPPKAAL